MQVLWTVLMGLVGVYAIVASCFNWDWFFNNYKAQKWVNLIGRTGARIFYIVLGLLLVAGAIYLLVAEYA